MTDRWKLRLLLICSLGNIMVGIANLVLSLYGKSFWLSFIVGILWLLFGIMGLVAFFVQQKLRKR